MPYIARGERVKLNKEINKLICRLQEADWNVGAVNYVFSRILWAWFDQNRRYATANSILGVLEAIKLEFYRRKAVAYETEKIEENGDI